MMNVFACCSGAVSGSEGQQNESTPPCYAVPVTEGSNACAWWCMSVCVGMRIWGFYLTNS